VPYTTFARKLDIRPFRRGFDRASIARGGRACLTADLHSGRRANALWWPPGDPGKSNVGFQGRRERTLIATTPRVRHRRSVSAATLLALVAGIAGACGGSDSDEGAESTTPAPTSLETAEPVGLVALGHSALTGENSDPGKPGQPALENSWATGTADGLDSIYQRMVELRPETEGHVENFAQGGAPAASLRAQATTALQNVPTPQLAIIQTIDGDIRCDGTDDVHVAEFGAALDDVLTKIAEASPETQILIITQPGRPALELESMADLINSEPAARALYTGPAPCGMLDDSGAQQPENIATLTAIIESYEAEQQRVCDKYPTCSTDEGALATFRREPSMVSSDFNHLNLEGQRRLAEAVWPTVQTLLDQP
jgi:lysophospholipase L1-like esterase